MKKLGLILALLSACAFNKDAEKLLGPGTVCEKDGGDDYQITCIRGDEVFICVYNRNDVACAPWNGVVP